MRARASRVKASAVASPAAEVIVTPVIVVEAVTPDA